MKLINLYKPFIGTKSKFLDKYPEDSQDIADQFWNSINDSCLFFILFLIAVSIGLCIFYFWIYNEVPGRHYKRTHWLCIYLITVLLAFFGTAALGYVLTNPSLNSSSLLLWKIAFGNLLYSIAIFGLFSCIWWLFLPTNAYNPLRKR